MKNRYEKLDFTKSDDRHAFARIMAEEGMVLLENKNNILPLGKEKVALFGRTQVDTIKGGTGSANSVSIYSVSIQDGLRDSGIALDEELCATYKSWAEANPIPSYGVWGSGMHANPEMPVSDELCAAAKARGAKKAIIVVGRTAGENEDVALVKGDYYLSGDEVAMFEAVRKHFDRVIVVLNIGNAMDLNFINEYGIEGVVYMNMAGMEAGHALGNILTGKVTPSGHLTATFAKSYEAYPSAEYFGQRRGGLLQDYKEDIFVGYRYFETFEGANDTVLYPFGYGLSYADFKVSDVEYHACTSRIHVSMTVTNVSKKYSGKYVAQVYYGAPQMGTGEAKLSKPAKVLGGWAKTKELAPGKSEKIKIFFPIKSMASFDDTGVTGHRSAWVLEAGDYTIYTGDSVMTAKKVGKYTQKKLKVIEKCHALPTALEERLLADGTFEKLDTIPLDPVKGLQIPTKGKYDIPVGLSASSDIEKVDCLCALKKGQSVTYNLVGGASGRYYISFTAGREDGRRLSDIAEIIADGAPVAGLDMVITKGESEQRIITLPMDKYTFTIKAKEDMAPITAIHLEKLDPTVFVKHGVENYIGCEQYAESAYRTITATFPDDGTGKPCTCLINMRRAGRFVVFKLNVEKGGVYDLSFNYANYTADMSVNECMAIFVSNVGQSLEDVTFYKTTESREAPVRVLRRSEPVKISLPNGECYLKIVSAMRPAPEFSALYLKSNDSVSADSLSKESTVKTESVSQMQYVGQSSANVYAEEIVEPEGIQLMDVYKNPELMGAFIDQLSNKELATLVSGSSRNVTPLGNSGTTQRISARGIPASQTADGPLGLRLNASTDAYPSGTLLASSWDVKLAEHYGLAVGHEANELGVNIWLAPGMNIHRDPRCGRNFEYYSEDPLVAGRIAANVTKGSQAMGVAVAAKHYAVNNTEHERLKSNSRISARAIREIYIKNFEICIKEGNPWSIMSSYNVINNTKACATYTLITEIPRDEWGWTGVFMTDWGNDSKHVDELHAGHDLKMCSGDEAGVKAALDSGELDRGQVKTCAARVVQMVMKTKAFTDLIEK